MQFDYNMLRSLLSLPDEQLWQTINSIANQNGVNLPKGTPPATELARLRNALGSTQNPNLREAMDIVNEYKKRNGM